MAVIANSVVFTAGVPGRTLTSLNGLGAAAPVTRLWITSPFPLRIGNTGNISPTNGLPITPLETNYFEFDPASIAGDNVSLFRSDNGPDFVIHIMTDSAVAP